MSSYKLIYFNAKGLGEAIRMILIYNGIEFKDYRVDYEDWVTHLKNKAPFGKLPLLEIDNKVIHQSMAICRYLGKETNLAGSNNWENLQIDMAAETFIDFKEHVKRVFFEQSDTLKNKKIQQLVNDTIPYYFERFDNAIRDNDGYFGISRLSWTDFYFVGYSETMEAILQEKVVERYPNISLHRRKLYSLPKIRDWLLKRPVTKY